jgi:hypothetical protein
MKTTKYLIAVAIVMAVLSFSAKANTITFIGEFDPGSQNPTTVLATANASGVDTDSDLLFADRFGAAGSDTNSFGTFTVSTGNTGPGGSQVEFLTFTLNPGFVLAGIGIHGGGGTVENFWSVSDLTSGTLIGPVHAHTNPNGKYADLSNFDIYVENDGAGVPDGGTTLIMFGAAMVGLVGLRRYFAQASI